MLKSIPLIGKSKEERGLEVFISFKTLTKKRKEVIFFHINSLNPAESGHYLIFVVFVVVFSCC